MADAKGAQMNDILSVLLGVAAAIAAVGWVVLCVGWAIYWTRQK